MGILLTEEESFQELYMKAVCYNQFASNAIKIPLYSLKEFDNLNDLGKLEDAAGKIATAKIYSIIDVIEVLKSLIQIQNKLYSREDADAVMKERREGACLTDAEYAYDMMMRAGASDNSNII